MTTLGWEYTVSVYPSVSGMLQAVKEGVCTSGEARCKGGALS